MFPPLRGCPSCILDFLSKSRLRGERKIQFPTNKKKKHIYFFHRFVSLYVLRSIVLTFCGRQTTGGRTFRGPVVLDVVSVSRQPWSYRHIDCPVCWGAGIIRNDTSNSVVQTNLVCSLGGSKIVFEQRYRGRLFALLRTRYQRGRREGSRLAGKTASKYIVDSWWGGDFGGGGGDLEDTLFPEGAPHLYVASSIHHFVFVTEPRPRPVNRPTIVR